MTRHARTDGPANGRSGWRGSRPARGRATALTTALLVLGTAGAALAYWTATGTGPATGRTSATTAPMTMTAGVPTTLVYPGGSAGVALTVTNPNAHSVHIGAFALDPTQGTAGFGVDAGHAGCGLAALGFVRQTNGGAGWSVPAKVGGVDGSLTLQLAGALTMTTGAAAACAGATFRVYLAAEAAA